MVVLGSYKGDLAYAAYIRRNVLSVCCVPAMVATVCLYIERNFCIGSSHPGVTWNLPENINRFLGWTRNA